MSDQPLLPDFEVRETTADTMRVAYCILRAMGAPAIVLLASWLGSLVWVAWTLISGKAADTVASIWAAAGAAMLALLGLAVLRTRSRTWTVRLSPLGLVARHATGELALEWAAVKRASEHAGILVLFAERQIVVLPVHRISPAHVILIRSFIERGRGDRQASRSGAKRAPGVMVWLLLVLGFAIVFHLLYAR